MTFKPTKWATYEFDETQLRARELLQRARSMRTGLDEALYIVSGHRMTCAEQHQRLDRQIEVIRRRKRKGLEHKAEKMGIELCHALGTVLGRGVGPRLHKYLDKRLDEIERLTKEATALFPGVDESFTVASGPLFPAE